MRARERILDAAAALMDRSGFQAVNMVAVAREAGVSRQTVYANFGTREDLLSEAIIRIVGQVFDRINERIGSRRSGPSDTPEHDASEHDASAQDVPDHDVPEHDVSQRIVELLVAVRSEFRRHSVLGALLFPDHGSPLFDDEVFARATPAAAQFLGPLVEHDPRLAARFDDVLEITMRFGLSILLFDSDAIRSDDDLRSFLHRSLIPALGL